MFCKKIYTAGFSLIEVLIATFLGALLTLTVLQNYLSAKNIHHTQTEIARLTENIRTADFILQQNILHAGFSGCRNISALNFINHTHQKFDEDNIVHGYDSAHAPSFLAENVLPGTDVLVIAKANADLTQVTTDTKARSTTIKVGANPATINNQFLLISDCVNAELFTAENWTGTTITATKALKNRYKANIAEVGRFEEMAFFIGDTGRISAKNKPVYSLFFSVNQGNRRELIPEICDMQISYGIATNKSGAVTKYLKAPQIADWTKVLSVIITLKPQNKLLALEQWKIYIKLRERN